MLSAIPAEVLACHSSAGVLAVERVQGFEMLKNDLCLECAQERRGQTAFDKERIDITKNPWCALRRATDHYSLRTGKIKHRTCTCGGVDIAVGDERQCKCRTRLLNRVVFGTTAKMIQACAAVNRQRRNAA